MKKLLSLTIACLFLIGITNNINAQSNTADDSFFNWLKQNKKERAATKKKEKGLEQTEKGSELKVNDRLSNMAKGNDKAATKKGQTGKLRPAPATKRTNTVPARNNPNSTNPRVLNRGGNSATKATKTTKAGNIRTTDTPAKRTCGTTAKGTKAKTCGTTNSSCSKSKKVVKNPNFKTTGKTSKACTPSSNEKKSDCCAGKTKTQTATKTKTAVKKAKYIKQ